MPAGVDKQGDAGRAGKGIWERAKSPIGRILSADPQNVIGGPWAT